MNILALKKSLAFTVMAAVMILLDLLPMRAEGFTQKQVRAAEQAFARTMAQRDLSGFARFISPEAVFFSGNDVVKGRDAVIRDWTPLFQGPQAPFSWAPDRVEVLSSGTLALSTGLVRDSHGKVIARFNTIWRLEKPGVWQVVFDKGSPATEAEKRSSR